ncbi:MAG: hypothetical protein GXP28_00320 [Planctomycetes bacterium]|nr:hypothetical protein [Planctomycetota bacterium]
MSQTPWTELIERIHASDYQLVIAVTGGGSKAISQLLEVAGASRTVLEAVVPYASSSLEAWLGGTPDQSCSEPTARAMAMAAWMRGRHLAPDLDPQNLVGVGATASLASHRPKRGEHRVHVAVQTATQTVSCSLQLRKDSRRDREQEQWLAAMLILLVTGEACQEDTALACEAMNDQLLKKEPLTTRTQQAEADWVDLLLGKQKYSVVPRQQAKEKDLAVEPQVIFPGAFNPPHAGHRRMAQMAAAKLGQPVAFELSITNVDKPPLDYVQLHERIEAFQRWDPTAKLLLTDAPTFCSKAARFPGCTFIVGADTIVRIADPRYYHHSLAARDAAIETIANHGCRFLVFGRHREGVFQSLADLNLPAALQTLCEEVVQSEFSEDISSTRLR